MMKKTVADNNSSKHFQHAQLVLGTVLRDYPILLSPTQQFFERQVPLISLLYTEEN